MLGSLLTSDLFLLWRLAALSGVHCHQLLELEQDEEVVSSVRSSVKSGFWTLEVVTNSMPMHSGVKTSTCGFL